MVFNGKNLFGNVFWLLSHLANSELGLVVLQLKALMRLLCLSMLLGTGTVLVPSWDEIRGVQNTFGRYVVQQ